VSRKSTPSPRGRGDFGLVQRPGGGGELVQQLVDGGHLGAVGSPIATAGGGLGGTEMVTSGGREIGRNRLGVVAPLGCGCG